MNTKANLRICTESNREAWDASATHHRGNAEWDRLKANFSNPNFSTFDQTMSNILKTLPIVGKSVVQVGCNNGRELLSTISLGATSGLGIDQSSEFIKQATELTEVAGRNCSYVTSDIYSLPTNLVQNYDVAIITIGVLNWMPDIDQFFGVVSGFLKKSGKLVVYETHPFLEMFDPDAQDPHTPAISYFTNEPYVSEQAIVYDDSTPAEVPSSYWFTHRLGDIVNACIAAGLQIENFTEYPHTNRETEYDIYENQSVQVPMCFSLIASKV